MKIGTKIGLAALLPISALLYGFFALSAAKGGEGCADIVNGDLIYIGNALRSYAMDHGERFPERLEDLSPDYVEDASLLKDLAYRPGLTERDDPEKIVVWDDHYLYHVCGDQTQVRALKVSGVFKIYNMGKKSFYQGKLRKTLFWRFLGVPIEKRKPTLAEIEQADAELS